MKTAQVKEMILYVAEQIIASKPYLTEVDSRIGDGDHGMGMEIGFKKVCEVISPKEYACVNDLFRDTGMAMLNSMGGASGVIFSTIFLGGMKGAEKTDDMTTGFLGDYLLRSLDSIKTRGKAQIGDKTMVDAFEPACLAFKEASDQGLDFADCFAKAEEAANKGMESTKNMVAKFGRAKSLMERAIGFQDAGATSVYLIFKAMHDWSIK